MKWHELEALAREKGVSADVVPDLAVGYFRAWIGDLTTFKAESRGAAKRALCRAVEKIREAR